MFRMNSRALKVTTAVRANVCASDLYVEKSFKN